LIKPLQPTEYLRNDKDFYSIHDAQCDKYIVSGK